MGRATFLGAVCAAVVGGTACSGQEAKLPVDDTPRLTVWAEFLPAEEVAQKLAFSGENHLAINVSLVEGEHDAAYMQAACSEAAKHGVPVRFWPGLSHELGYWPSQANVDHFLEYVDQLVATAEDACPNLEGIAVDLEMPIYRMEEMAAKREAGESEIAIAGWLLEGVDEAAFEHARGAFDDAVKRLRGKGLTVFASTLPMNADDYADGDETIAKALWTPIEGIDWDHVSFQVYRSLYDAEFPPESGAPYTSGLVASYARTVRERWGDKGGVDLGTTGSGIGVEAGLGSAAELQSDIAAALAEGILPEHIAVYSLEGLDGSADAAAWLALPEAKAAPITDDDEEPRKTFQALDLAD